MQTVAQGGVLPYPLLIRIVRKIYRTRAPRRANKTSALQRASATTVASPQITDEQHTLGWDVEAPERL